MTHPTAALNDIVHQRHRLGLLAIAGEAARVEFTHLHQTLELTRGNLNRHLAVLEEAGLVVLEKGYDGRRPKTWVVITAGRAWFRGSRWLRSRHTPVSRMGCGGWCHWAIQ
ncbi:transcriptional regulator [Nonomuraea sp. NPDC049695]|uniref:transcriptional regulator n=1 Tax=Nonomuraea sp. NPDC049695 TaxID=3154734 RepID=UPI00342D328E